MPNVCSPFVFFVIASLLLKVGGLILVLCMYLRCTYNATEYLMQNEIEKRLALTLYLDRND